MYSFANDYSEGACQEVLKNLIRINNVQSAGYGQDDYCEYASKLIKMKIGSEEMDIHFIPGGTQCNVLAITLLKPYEAVICADTGHINVHETGAVEATGHKIISVKNTNGKIIPEQIESVCLKHTDEHMVKPRMVFISNSTELGTIYTKEELSNLYKMCKKYNLYLYMDGARLGSALVSRPNNLTLRDIYENTDLFYIGGTKNGALLGEAFIIRNPELRPNFRFLIKQHCAMLAKARIMGVQFATLFTDDLYFKLASNANMMAQALRNMFGELNIPMFVNSPTNQIFPIVDNALLEKIQSKYIVTIWDKYDSNHTIIRIVCSWATTKEDIKNFYKDLIEFTRY